MRGHSGKKPRALGPSSKGISKAYPLWISPGRFTLFQYLYGGIPF